MILNRRVTAAFVWLTLLMACSSEPTKREGAHEDDDTEATRVSLSVEAYETAGIAVEPAGSGRAKPTIQVTGTLTYDERKMAIATARIGGRITRVIADYGQRVSRDETLALIDSPELGAAQAEYLRARSMSHLRKAEHDRARLLLEGEAISLGEALRREAEWQASEAELKTAEQKLHILGLSQSDIEALLSDRDGSDHVYPVRAPIDGIVTERRAVPGRVVSADDELFTVARLESLWLFLQIFEKDLPVVKEGAGVTLTCESHPNHHFDGNIDFVGQVLDPHSRTVQARAIIDNSEGKLKPGMFVYASIEVRVGEADGGESRLLVPLAAVASLDGGDIVFVRVADRTFELRNVILGETSQDWAEVRSGLEPGDMVAIDGVFTLKSEVLKGGLEGHAH